MTVAAKPPGVNGSKPSTFEEEARPAGSSADAEAKEKARLDEEIRKRAEATGAGPGPDRTGAAGNGAGSPGQGGPGTGKAPVFDRDAAAKRLLETPSRSMTKDVGDKKVCIFDDQELALLDLDVAALKKKPDEKKAALKRYAVADLVKLQQAKNDLNERARSWRRRALELEEEAFAAGAKASQGKSAEQKKAEFLAKITGAEPWLAWNGLLIQSRADKKLGDWSQELMFGETETAILAPLTKMAVEENADALLNLVIEIGPTAGLAIALATFTLPKAWMAYQRWKAETEEAEAARRRGVAKPAPAAEAKP